MKVKDILEKKGRGIICVRASEAGSALCHKLRMERVGALVVSDDGEMLQGFVSERDVVACVATHGSEAATAGVSEIMSTRVVTCSEDDNISVIARKMSEHRIRHIPVLEDSGLASVVCIGDTVKNRLEEVELGAGVLRDMALTAH